MIKKYKIFKLIHGAPEMILIDSKISPFSTKEEAEAVLCILIQTDSIYSRYTILPIYRKE